MGAKPPLSLKPSAAGVAAAAGAKRGELPLRPAHAAPQALPPGISPEMPTLHVAAAAVVAAGPGAAAGPAAQAAAAQAALQAAAQAAGAAAGATRVSPAFVTPADQIVSGAHNRDCCVVLN